MQYRKRITAKSLRPFLQQGREMATGKVERGEILPEHEERHAWEYALAMFRFDVTGCFPLWN